MHCNRDAFGGSFEVCVARLILSCFLLVVLDLSTKKEHILNPKF